jgi:hypothetical protein
LLTRLLFYLSALLLSVLLAIGLAWVFEHYRERPHPPPSLDDSRLSIRPAAHLARSAVRRFHALPAVRQQALRDALRASISTLDVWAGKQGKAASVLCLGERHENSTRAFIAAEILPLLDYQVLMLEASQTQLQTMLGQLDAAQPVTLLHASLDEVLNVSKARIPPVRIVAIDEHQTTNKVRQTSDRESSLVRHIRQAWQQEQRHVVLFGALHCRAEPGWMMYRLVHEDARIRRAGALGIVILARYREASAQVLMYFLEEIGLGRGIAVVAQVSLFPKLIQKWLPLVADAFAGYDSAIVFDDRAESH